jgi:crossover junction endodeoxyribonuclease RuvC
MRIIGIDPGKTGAVAVLWETGRASVYDLNGSHHDTVALLQELTRDYPPQDIVAIVEAVGPHPKEGVRSVWTFAEGVGVIRGALISLGTCTASVTPSVWKRAFGLIGQDKNGSRDKARSLFPALSAELRRVKDAGRAEALLIASYYRLDKHRTA